jgi:hypothetical protein
MSGGTLRELASATPTFGVKPPPQMVQQLNVHGGNNINIHVRGGLNAHTGGSPAIPTPSPFMGMADGDELRHDGIFSSPDDGYDVFSPPPGAEAACNYKEEAAAHDYKAEAALDAYAAAYDCKAEAARDAPAAHDDRLNKPLAAVLASPAFFAAMPPADIAAAADAAATAASSLEVWTKLMTEGKHGLAGLADCKDCRAPHNLDGSCGCNDCSSSEDDEPDVPARTTSSAFSCVPAVPCRAEAPAPAGRSNQTQLDELGNWMMLGPGLAHELDPVEKLKSLARVREYLLVRNRAGNGGMTAKGADLYVLAIDEITELGGLTPYGLDPLTPGLSLFNDQLSSGLSGDSLLIRSVASAARKAGSSKLSKHATALRHLARYLGLLRGRRADNAAAAEEKIALAEGREPAVVGEEPRTCSLGWAGCPYDRSAPAGSTLRMHCDECLADRQKRHYENNKKALLKCKTKAAKAAATKARYSREWRARQKAAKAEGKPRASPRLSSRWVGRAAKTAKAANAKKILNAAEKAAATKAKKTRAGFRLKNKNKKKAKRS